MRRSRSGTGKERATTCSNMQGAHIVIQLYDDEGTLHFGNSHPNRLNSEEKTHAGIPTLFGTTHHHNSGRYCGV
jgi:hypothetical protein